MTPTLLTLAQVADRTGISLETLRYWRHIGEGPKSFKLGRRVVIAQDDLDQWIADQRAAADETRQQRR